MTGVTVIGLYPIEFSPALLRDVMLRWHGPDTHYESDSDLMAMCEEWGPQIEQTMEGLHLIELLIDSNVTNFSLENVSQDRRPGANSQVPYDEHWLNADGTTIISDGYEPPVDRRPLRVVFFLHLVRTNDPLYIGKNPNALPLPTALPDRLRELVPYDPPT